MRAIWEGQRTAGQTKTLCLDTFERHPSAEAEDWGLASAVAVQSDVPTGCLWSKTVKTFSSFLGIAFSLAPHAVAQCFKDNHFSLVRTCFRLSERRGAVPCCSLDFTRGDVWGGGRGTTRACVVWSHLADVVGLELFGCPCPRDQG